jgi:hypothetical protein
MVRQTIVSPMYLPMGRMAVIQLWTVDWSGPPEMVFRWCYTIHLPDVVPSGTAYTGVVTPEEFVPTSSVGVGEAPELLSENCPAAVEVPYGTSDHST